MNFDSKEFEKKYCENLGKLGVTYTKEKSIFRVWAVTAETAVLNLYSKGSDEEGSEKLGTHEMVKGENGVFTCEVSGDLNKVYYTYTITVDGVSRETQDVYSVATGVNGRRSMVVDLQATNPEGFEDDKHVVFKEEDTLIWELHIGDFSNDPDSGVREEYQGKYLAFTEENTSIKGEGKFKTCMSYIKDLGVTHVHLLPTFDYGSIDESKATENINWGYDPYNYNVPEGSYSTNPFDGAVRIKEFKQMVQAFHKAGISVVMDVVFNHTYNTSDSCFEKTVPGYYYRHNEDGSLSNGSACGNDTASDRLMFRKYMVDSVMYWANEYHVDGFRFDLMGLHDVETMNEIRTALNTVEGVGKDMILYGEPWSAGDSGFLEGSVPANKDAVNKLVPGIKIFNDNIRDTIKGRFDELEVPGFANGKPNMEAKMAHAYVGGFEEGFPTPESAAKLINYVSAHDNSTLWDKLVDSVKHNKDYDTIDEELFSINGLAAAIYITSKGIPFMQAGEEAGRSKQGEDNSYNLSKKLNMLDWKRMAKFTKLTDYYKELFNIRRHFECINSLSRESADKTEWLNKDEKKQVVVMKNDKLVFIFNASKEAYVFEGKGEYKVLAKGFDVNINGLENVSGQIKAAPLSMTLLEEK